MLAVFTEVRQVPSRRQRSTAERAFLPQQDEGKRNQDQTAQKRSNDRPLNPCIDIPRHHPNHAKTDSAAQLHGHHNHSQANLPLVVFVSRHVISRFESVALNNGDPFVFTRSLGFKIAFVEISEIRGGSLKGRHSQKSPNQENAIRAP